MIVWKTPAETHGSIIGYLLTFQKGEQSTDVYVVDPTYHYHVIQPSDIPPGTGKVSVEVSSFKLLTCAWYSYCTHAGKGSEHTWIKPASGAQTGNM